MTQYRREHDLLGSRDVPAEALYGISTLRAMENFPLTGRPVRPALIHAFGAVKLACARTNHELGHWVEAVQGRMGVFEAIERACSEMMEGQLDRHIVVDALQGGAGTSTNMNVNEVLANRALELMGHTLGDYTVVHPLDDINLHQSTNDTYPTALRVAAIAQLRALQREVVALQEAFQAKEKAFAHVVKIGRTEYQDAVLITLGREMSAYAEAFSRDRWRIYKAEERLRTVNLGGTAVGTGLGAPRQFIFRAVEHLRDITRMGLARADNLIEATQNADAFVEVSGILKTLASNLLKCCSDLRLLSSGPDAGIGEIRLPPRQAGSTIMPGKINPVIPESASQVAITVMANDQALTMAAAMGSLELNAFAPLIAETLLSNLELLTAACTILRTHCVTGIEANEERCKAHVDATSASLTAMVHRIGYEAASALGLDANREGKTIRQLVIERGLMSAEQFDELTHPHRVMKLGSS